MEAVAEEKVNTVPFEGSWSAPQLLIHITKSMNEMAHILQMDAKPAERNPEERIAELKKIFLDFSLKFPSPAFIFPENGIYERQATIDQFNHTFQTYRKSAIKTSLAELVEGLLLDPITKMEIVYFTLFHTQRHLYQMKKIVAAL